MLKLEKNKITLKANSIFLGIGIIVMIMSIIGFRIVFGLLPFEEEDTLVDILVLIFICLWPFIASSIGISAFVTNSKKIEINDEGVLCCSFFEKMFLKWSEIEDWGLSYCGQTKGEGNTYYFYFSKNLQKTKNECKKALKGKMIKIEVIGNDYYEIVSMVIPFCKEKTSVEPFIGKDKYHFI